MDKNNKYNHEKDSAEQMLDRFYHSVNPEPQFASQLERKLQDKVELLRMDANSPSSAKLGNTIRSLSSWSLGLLGLAALAAIIIFAINLLPQASSLLPAVGQTATPKPVGKFSAIQTPTLSMETPISSPWITTAAPAMPVGSLTPTLEPFPPHTFYRVGAGETCASIADQFSVSVESLIQLNGLPADCSSLFIDQELRIPDAARQLEFDTVYLISRNGNEPVNLRSGPGTNFRIVGTFRGEDRLKVRSDLASGGWVAVEYLAAPDGVAWVWSELVIKIDPDKTDTPPQRDLNVNVSNLRRDGDSLLVDLCFALPNGEDWMVNEVIFGYWKEDLTHLVPPSGSSLISLTPPREDGTQGQRCDAFEFDIPVPDILSPTLQVLSISAYPREGQSCQVYQERVQPALDEQNTGIQISCEEQPHTSTMTIDRLPEGMSLETAEAIVYQVFKDAISIYGPWKFDLSPSAAPSEDIPDVADLQPLLADLRELKALRVQTFFSKPGWLHTQAQEGWDTASNAPDGSPLPSDYLTDEWFALDENGRITISVVRNLDLHGNILYTQVSRAEESLAWEDMYTLPAMDYGFTDIAESWGKVSKPISSQPAVIDDVAIGDRYILQDEGSRIEAIYDPGTGQLLSMKTYEVTPDGLKLIHAVSILVMEKFAEAPLEILKLVNSTPSTP